MWEIVDFTMFMSPYYALQDSQNHDVKYLENGQVWYSSNKQEAESLRDKLNSSFKLYVFPEFMFTQCEYSELAFAIAESEERAKEIIAKKREQDVEDIYFGECQIHSLDQECCYLSL